LGIVPLNPCAGARSVWFGGIAPLGAAPARPTAGRPLARTAHTLPSPLEPVARLQAAADAASAQIRAVKVKQKNLKLELRTVKDRTTKAMVDGKVRQYDARFTTGQNSMKQILHELDRLELTSGAGGGSQYPTMGANDGMLNKVGKAQDNIDRSLTRTANMVNETQDVAAATLEEMKTQQEKITAIDEEIATIETRLGRADKLIKTFGKRMMTDKCIQVVRGVF